jgi:transcriptional regulator with XRE-family HTH domain
MSSPKQMRIRLGLTQQALARVLGVSLRTVVRWEAGSPVHPIFLLRMDRMLSDDVPQEVTRAQESQEAR